MHRIEIRFDLLLAKMFFKTNYSIHYNFKDKNAFVLID